MSEDTSPRRCFAGFNQFVRLVRRGIAFKVYLACDADMFYSVGVRKELEAHPEIELDATLSSARLAEMAGVDVPTAVLTFAGKDAI